ncbi:MAG: hypothetical protein ACLT2T_00265 [Bilophila wadsworthia]
MFKIIIPILVIALAAFVGMNAKSGLIRGVADGMLAVSPARPAVAVKPAADFASVDARRVDLRLRCRTVCSRRHRYRPCMPVQP